MRRYYWLLAGRRASDPAAVRRHAAEDLGAASAGRLTRGLKCNEARMAKKGHKCGAVSEKRPESCVLRSVPRQRGLR